MHCFYSSWLSSPILRSHDSCQKYTRMMNRVVILAYLTSEFSSQVSVDSLKYMVFFSCAASPCFIPSFFFILCQILLARKMPSTRSFSLSLLLPALALSVPTNTASCTYNALGVGTFTHHAIYSFDGHALPAGLRPNTDTVGGAPFTRIYDPSLLTFSDGYVNLRVPGGQRSSPIRGAGINTVAGNILYASVRTNAIFSRVPGTVQSQSP